MSSEYNKKELKRWFFIPMIPYLIMGVILFFVFGDQDGSFVPGLSLGLGISAIVNAFLLVPIYLVVNFKVKERVQGILLSTAVIGLLTFFACFAPNSY
jgi:hypothetical protein